MSLRKSNVRLLGGAAFGSVLAILALAPMTALAGEGNGSYLGVVSSTAPSGYIPSPASYSVGQVLNFQFNVTNLTAEQQSMTLQLNLNHIISYVVNGQALNVSDGQPGVANGAIVDGQFNGQMSTQVQDSSPTTTAFSIGPNATQTVHLSRNLPAGQCGYFQVDVAKAGLTSQKGLIGFEIRVLGCITTPVATTPSPSGGVGGSTASPSPTPAGGVGGATSGPTPSGAVLAATGSTPPTQFLALVLIPLGALALITGFALRRRES